MSRYRELAREDPQVDTPPPVARGGGGPPIAVGPTAIVLLEKPLVLGLEVLLEDHGVPSSSGFSVFGRLVEKLRRSRHGRPRRGYGVDLTLAMIPRPQISFVPA
jgi:hypothetical protein